MRAELALIALSLICILLPGVGASRLPPRALDPAEPGHALVRHLAKYELHDFSGVEAASHPGRRLFDTAGSDALSFELRAFDRVLTVDLVHFDDLFDEGYTHAHLDGNGKVLHESGPLDCIYRATIREHPTALGAVSLCGGQLHATLHSAVDLDAFTVQPLDIHGSTKEHAVYRHLDIVAEEEYRCGTDEFMDSQTAQRRLRQIPTHDHAEGHTHASASQAHDHALRKNLKVPPKSASSARARNLYSNDKQYSVTVFNDYERFITYGSNTERHSIYLFATVKTLYAAFPKTLTQQVFTITFTLANMFTFTVTDPYGTFASPVDPSTLLSTFDNWRETYFTATTNVGHLLSGIQFVSPIIGLAFTGAVCGNQRSSICQANHLSDAQIASTSTHELGHNLGFNHDGNQTLNGQRSGWGAPFPDILDCWTNAPAQSPSSAIMDDKCYCPTPSPTSAFLSIMAASSGSVAHTNWTQCSEAWLVYHLTQQYGPSASPACLETVAGLLSEPYCGNGLIEAGEECDCINGDCSNKGSSDNCCTGGTGANACKLKATFTCSATQPCCNPSTCVPYTTHPVCRPAVDKICDFPEYCDGVNATCPPDLFADAGLTCISPLNYTGTCYSKNCLSLQDECATTSPSFAAQPCPGLGISGLDGTCQQVQCESKADTSQCLVTVPGTPVADGMQCGTGKGCRTVAGIATCQPFASIPPSVESGPCFDGIKDFNETDVDCGGPQCFACGVGLACLVDRDCFPTACVNNKCAAGAIVTPQNIPLCPTCPQQVQDAIVWFQNNLVIWVPIVSVLALVCCLYCFWPHSDPNTGQKTTRLQRHAATVGGSFRSLPVAGSFRRVGAPTTQKNIPTAQLVASTA